MTQLTIEGISQKETKFGKKITLLAGGKKYDFFSTKQDGSLTKAYDQYQRFGYQIGQVVNAEVKEEQKTFVNEKGRTVPYTERRILFFEEVENMPIVRQKPPISENKGNSCPSCEERLRKLENDVNVLLRRTEPMNEEKSDDLPF